MSSRKVFKELLRTVDKYVTKVSNNNIWRNFIIQEFRREEDPETPSSTRNATAPENPSKMSLEFLLNAAQDYTYLVKCIHENKRLLVSYNITTDKDAQQMESVRKIASKVGLKLP